MFNGLYSQHVSVSDAELASQTLAEETVSLIQLSYVWCLSILVYQTYRFPAFSSNDAVTLGLSIRKRFRGSSRHAAKGRGLVIKIQTVAGHDLFSCTVGDLGAASSLGDVSLDAWASIDGMINVVRRTGHSSYYVEKGIGAMGMSIRRGGGEELTVRIAVLQAKLQKILEFVGIILSMEEVRSLILYCCKNSHLTLNRKAFPIWLQVTRVYDRRPPNKSSIAYAELSCFSYSHRRRLWRLRLR